MNSLKYLSSIVFFLSANPSCLSYTRPYVNNHLLVFRQWIYSRPTLLSKFDVVVFFFVTTHPYYNRFKKRLLRSTVCVELTFVFMISLFCRLTGDESNKQVYHSKGRWFTWWYQTDLAHLTQERATTDFCQNHGQFIRFGVGL